MSNRSPTILGALSAIGSDTGSMRLDWGATRREIDRYGRGLGISVMAEYDKRCLGCQNIGMERVTRANPITC